MAHEGQFKKGHDPRRNPGGRPKLATEVRRLALEKCPRALEVLVEVMEDPKARKKDRTYAANSILDRGLGRPTTVLASDSERPLQLEIDRQLVELFTKIVEEGERSDGSGSG